MCFKNLSATTLAMLLLLGSCSTDADNNGYSGPSVGVNLSVENIKESTTASLAKNQVVQGKSDLNVVPGWINAAAPEYLKITLLSVALEGDFTAAGFDQDEYVVWSGEKEITLSGSAVDLSDINSQIDSVPIGTLQNIKLTIKSQAKVKGSLTANFKLDDSNGPDGAQGSITVFTKANYGYSATDASGGAENYTDFETGPAEETTIDLDAFGENMVLNFETNQTLTEDSTPKLTLFFDLNRVLRFYNGKAGANSGGVNPTDRGDRAYFFAHSLFGRFINVYFGNTGTVEGYKTMFYNGDMAVTGWLSLVFDANDNFLSGIIMGNNDNDLSIAKGRITSFVAQPNGNYDFTYQLDGGAISFTVNGFERAANVQQTTNATYTGSINGNTFQGDASFELKLKRQ